MHRCVLAVAILVVAAFCPALGQARTAMECIQHSEYKFRNLCSRNVIVGWCISQPEDGYNLEHSTVCGNHSSMYYGWMTIVPPGSSTTSFGWHGGLRWAACFSPKRPVATRGGARFVCRSRAASEAAAPAPERREDAPDPAAERRFQEALCASRRRAVERHRPRCAQGEEISCEIVDVATRNLRRYCR